MALYFFHLRDGVDLVIDEEGRLLDGPDAIAAAALEDVRSIVSDDARSGQIKFDQRIDVEDEARTIVYSLAFADAFSIIWPEAA